MRAKQPIRRLSALLLAMMILFACGASGEEAALQTPESAALAQGMALKTVLTCDWGSLKIASEALNGALKALAEESTVTVIRQGKADEWLFSLDWAISGASALDVSAGVRDGAYYEQSNILGGKTVCLEKENLSEIAARLRAAEGEAMPAWQSLLLAAGEVLLEGEASAADSDVTGELLSLLKRWREDSLVQSREKLGGLTSEITVVTQSEAVALLDEACALLESKDALWQSAALDRAGQDGEAAKALLSGVRRALEELPAKADNYLDRNSAVIYCVDRDAEGNAVLRQADAVAGESALHVEWTLADGELSTLSASGEVEGIDFRLVLTCEKSVSGNANRLSTQRTLRLEAESLALFGEGARPTLLVETSDTVSGAGADYSRRFVATVRLDGLGALGGKVLELTAKTTAQPELSEWPDSAAETVYPTRMEAEALGEWYLSMRTQVSQAVFTFLGRLPAKTAQFLLGLML